MFHSLQTYMKLKEPVTVIYIGKNEEITERTIIVKSVSPGMIRAFCLKRQEIRTFRIDRILAAVPARKRRSYGRIS
ncbi:WYL domain-containing protein [Domibacillus epiphyticus]|uniref:WYL domain-containing protein n=1 Tax=Domibacillus epiphyticus TaxID=1714355 RepID=A0A1V2A7U0_9BACI|nr:hypothetical protein [Domibacillus epiphyticus]OMP67071.1 hypothetical protein BTO28_08805 [Domibacillus epiphyticus]